MNVGTYEEVVTGEHFGTRDLALFPRSGEQEWLVTNGLGGFASATVAGANTRRYHGLLFASLRPPTERILLLSKLEEKVTVRGKEYFLSVNDTAGGTIPAGQRFLQQFTSLPVPTFVYSFEDVIIVKRVFMVHGENTTVVGYKVFAPDEVTLQIEITPLVNCRDYHHMTKRNNWPFNQKCASDGTEIEAYPGALRLYLTALGLRYFSGEGYWYEGMRYREEARRGEHEWEDHYMPGKFSCEVKGDTSFAVLASDTKIQVHDWEQLLQQESARQASIIETAGLDEAFAQRLVLAADNFIVERRSTGTATVIAGYPWFTDWGRDTMIALTGLTLVTQRFNEARDILTTFARYCRDGLIPNRFPDEGLQPDYNTVDASLWYFHSVHRFLQYTGDYEFILNNIYPSLKSIVEAHIKGTHFNIHMDKDGLIVAGERDLQLTWMDAKVDDWVVTPRHGKPVEINALWYNALRVLEKLAEHFGQQCREYGELAQQVKDSFAKEFWNEAGGCLYDVIGDHKDMAIRPNQIIAVSLPYTMLERNKEKSIVNTVWRYLYTPYGLRTLSPQDPQYHGIYQGGRVERDGAYHQGTAWSWLMGPFITAYRKVNDYSPKSRQAAAQMLQAFQGHLHDHGVGSVSELFDGDHPHFPGGCIAQAWGVAEVLRAYVEEVLEIKP